MKHFRRQLAEAQPPDAEGRRWIYVPYDQLTHEVGPLNEAKPGALGIVLVESAAKAERRPYHKQKLALVLANQRHFALEQAKRGVAVEYLAGEAPYRQHLASAAKRLGPLTMMRPAERELRVELAPLVDSGAIEVVPHAGWMTTTEMFVDGAGLEAPWRMDAFYRHVRQSLDLLMENGKPLGGKYSHDAANREPWSGEPAAPIPPTFRPDDITREVAELVETRFADHPGRLDVTTLPTTRRQALRMWRWALASCMHEFGPYEDAMSTKSRGIFHTRISGLLNLLRLLPAKVVADVAAADIPLNSKEGFIRQVIGWREFVRHVHEATDGFRTVGGPAPSFLDAHDPLPATFWGGAPSGLACLDTVVDDVWDEAYSHHITRLMILSNLGTLLDVEPRELTDWFWAAYQDAYEWVVEPNVLAMGMFAVGPVMTTKPYVSGTPYINKMSDYCKSCDFDPKKTCPISSLYWDFLRRNADRLAGNQRLRMPLASQRKQKPEVQQRHRETADHVRAALARGERLAP
ncbi:MAG: cryptochrome/photolyase family protein [Planctomycetota bacterium]|nr:cryptochrome/photolyase family protein [Planctomycetota bacterium]